MKHITDAAGDKLVPFVCDVIAFGSVVQTDGWSGYNALSTFEFEHQRTILSSSDDQAHVSMPGVHRVASLLILRAATVAVFYRLFLADSGVAETVT